MIALVQNFDFTTKKNEKKLGRTLPEWWGVRLFGVRWMRGGGGGQIRLA